MIRDRWILRTAEISIARLVTLSEMIRSGSGPAGCATAAIRQYTITEENIRELAGMVGHALTSTAPTRETIPDRDGIKEKILTTIRESAGLKGIPLPDLLPQPDDPGLENGR